MTKLASSFVVIVFVAQMSPGLHWKNRKNTLGKDQLRWLEQRDLQPYF